MNKLLTEFIGTFFLTFAVAMAVDHGAPLIPLIIGLALMVMVYMGGHISGAHYNPAVTIAVWIRRKIATEQAIPYIVVQLLGAFAAAAVAYGFNDRALYIQPSDRYSTASILAAESLFTFALALVVLNVATVKQVAGNSYYGIAIGMTVAIGAACVGAISGAAFNPAVGVGTLLFAAIKGASILHAWIYIVGPVMGAIVAALVFKIQHGTTAD